MRRIIAIAAVGMLWASLGSAEVCNRYNSALASNEGFVKTNEVPSYETDPLRPDSLPLVL